MPSHCPNCGSDLPRNAVACPECGADDETGWKDETDTESIGIPGDDFDYDEFVENEFGPEKPNQKPWVILTAAILLIAIASWFF